MKVEMSEEEWQEKLSPEQFYVLRQEGTEKPFASELNNQKENGKFCCAGCGNHLFDSDAKYDSGTGWPSFFKPANKDAVTEHEDRKLFRVRTEIKCADCGGHLGHVFEDGPEPTGLRYCMNGAALKFKQT